MVNRLQEFIFIFIIDVSFNKINIFGLYVLTGTAITISGILKKVPK